VLFWALVTSAESPAATSDPTALIVLGAFTLLGTVFTGTIAYLSSRHAKTAANEATEANLAVNHKEQNQPRLFTMVYEMRATVKGVQKQLEGQDERFDNFASYTAEQFRQVAAELTELRLALMTVMRDVEERSWDGKTERRHTGETPVVPKEQP
jgi:cbb3-type cytochrome oxidase subunit 3